MRGAPRRWARIVGLVGGIALLGTACTNQIAGSPVAGTIPALTAAQSVSQSVLNFGEAATVHYKGTLTSASGEKIAFDLTASSTGEVLGSITVNNQPATILVINKNLYVKAPSAFWSSLRGLGGGEGKGTAIADRWVKLPTVLLGVDFGETFNPDGISQALGKISGDQGDGALSDRPASTESGVQVVRVVADNGTAYLAAQPPNGLVKLELPQVGSSEGTKVKDLVADVADTTADVGKFYQDVATQAGGLNTAVDALITVEQGDHKFDACGADSCSLIVQFTNTAKVPVRVHVKADWTGDNAPLGTCEVEVGPIAPGAPGSATCVLSSPEWADFWKKAHSVVGTHPYGASWAPLVLADPPDVSAISTRANAKPADPKNPKSEGSNYLYLITYTDKVWKYGVVGSKYWQDHAKQQLQTCLATNRVVCSFALVTAADNTASAYALESQLIDTYKSEKGSCPAGQWVSCKH
jgi:hypothetical protein